MGARIGAELIGGSVYELEAGDRLWPFHTHHANEEWLLVVRGQPTLRTPEGEHELKEGDVVAFTRGDEGAHQVSNRTDAPIRVLMLSTLIGPTSSTTPTAGSSAREMPRASACSSVAPARSSITGMARTRKGTRRGYRTQSWSSSVHHSGLYW